MNSYILERLKFALSELQGGDKQVAIEAIRELYKEIERKNEGFTEYMEEQWREQMEEEHENHEVRFEGCHLCEAKYEVYVDSKGEK